MTASTLIDRHDEREVFRSMFAEDSPRRILQLGVPAGGGKSGLLSVFVEYCREGVVVSPRQEPVRVVLVDFNKERNEALTELDVAQQVRSALRRYHRTAFADFSAHLEALSVENRSFFWPSDPMQINAPTSVSDVTNAHIIGVQLNQAARTPFTTRETQTATTRCLEVFSTDLEGYVRDNDVLVVFDTWEKAPPAVQDWVRQQFVCDCIASAPGGPAASRLRLVVAGRPRTEQATGLSPDERLDWGTMTAADYEATVSRHARLSRFGDEHVRLFLSLYGIDDTHPSFGTIYKFVGLCAQRGNLELARQSALFSAPFETVG